MNIHEAYENIKQFKKLARKDWGAKVKFIQLSLQSKYVNYTSEMLTNNNVDIYPFIKVTLTDNYNDGLEEKEVYSDSERRPYDAGQKPAWVPTTEDMQANDWYIYE